MVCTNLCTRNVYTNALTHMRVLHAHTHTHERHCAASSQFKGTHARPRVARSISAGHRRPPLPSRSMFSPPEQPDSAHGIGDASSGAGLLSMLHDAAQAAVAMGGVAPVHTPQRASSRAGAPAGRGMPFGLQGPLGGMAPPPAAAAAAGIGAVPVRRQSADAAWAGGFGIGGRGDVGGGLWGGGSAHAPAGSSAWEQGAADMSRQGLPPSQLFALSNQWRDKSDMSEALLHRHAAWLRDFREQVRAARAANLGRSKQSEGSSQRAAWPTLSASQCVESIALCNQGGVVCAAAFGRA